MTMRSFQISCRLYRRLSSTNTNTTLHRWSSSYKSIGSFHSENLAELMEIDDALYQPPELPFAVEDTATSLRQQAPSHYDIRNDFALDLSNWTFLNHGAFGGPLRVGLHRADAWRVYAESQPLRYFDRLLLPHLAHSTRLLTKFVSADRKNVTLLQNVTAGLNAVLAGFVRVHGRDDAHVVVLDTTYGSVKKMAQCYFGAECVTEIPLQAKYLENLATTDDPQRLLEDCILSHLLKTKNKPTLLILDHTSSNTAITFPIQRLSHAAKQVHPNLTVLVDGAHGLLAQEIDLASSRGVDFYLSNGHKWLSAPRGVALLYAEAEFHDSILRQPAVISHGVDAPDLLSRFVWDGTRDYSAALAIPAVLEYWSRRYDSIETVRQSCRETLKSGIEILARSWHPGVDFENWPGRATLLDFETFLSPMALVRIPHDDGNDSSVPKTSSDAKALQDFLYENNVEVPIKCINGRLYVRLSCHVYNRLEDFDRLRMVMEPFHARS